ncbi:MAG TPA: ADOP family duplicated permease [Candidatus Sulfopaludibacter sp.]|nr:ADOP family duplicated permease [Candidatus Sulfopaludibacter sp.]
MLRTLRTLRRSPGFAAATILTLALGVGANTGAFSALNTLLLRPLPYPHPDRLVTLYETTADRKPRDVAEANLFDWRKRSALFEQMAAFRPRSFGLTLGTQDAVTVIQTGMTTAGFLPAIGVAPSLGRTFTEDEEASDSRVIVLSDRLWRAQFGADPATIGRKIFLNEEAFTVIGVMPAGFEFPMDRVLPQAFIPLSRRDYCCVRAGSLAGIGRIKPAVSQAAARAELEAIGAQLAAEYPATNAARSVGLRPLAETMAASRREPLLLLMAAATLLLLIACANVSGLMVARGFARSHEAAIRASLGGGAWQIARPFFAEAIVLAAAGGLGGLFAARLVLRMVPRFIAGAADVGPLRLDAAAFTFALALAAALTLIMGAAPLLAVRRADLNGLMKAGGKVSARGPRSYGRATLVMVQVAFSAVLLLGAGLLLRSFLHLLDTSPGFQTAHALRFGLGLPEKRYDTDLKLVDFHHRLLDRLRAIPGVTAVGAVLRFPLRGGAGGTGGAFQIAGDNLPVPQRPHAWINAATPGYFAAMAIPLLAGRDFSGIDDKPGIHRVAIVNQAFARAYLRQRRPLGTVLELRWVSDLNPPGSTWEIIGVAGDTRQWSLDRPAVPEIFLSMTQIGSDSAGYVIRARGDDAALARAIAAAVVAQDSRLERVSVVPMKVLVERNLASRTAALELVGGFAVLALLLTAVGVYGIVAFRAAERSHEMAIRMALGASAGHVRGLVVGDALRMSMTGAAVGAAAFLFVAPLLQSQLVGVAAFDPVSIAVVVGSLCVVALVASAIPSRRAARNSPITLLRVS